MYKAVIFGISGTSISAEERAFFTKERPAGLILFSRNISNKKQIQKLTRDFREIVKNPTAPILIDQEGGRVSRLRSPTWYSPPAISIFGKIAKLDLKEAILACQLNTDLISRDLLELEINVNCAPIADLPIEGAHDVIGDRAFSYDKTIVTSLVQITIDSFINRDITPIIKHIPGHGRATVDSHFELPIVTTDYSTLKETDFYPFKNTHNALWAMTAHVIYTAIDSKNPATQSKKTIDEIRSTIDFRGLIVTDSITMHALSGNMSEKADKSFKSGCDLVIHSNGRMQEMKEIIKYTPVLNASQLELLERSCKIGDASLIDVDTTKHQLDSILKKYEDSKENKQSSEDPTENLIY